MQRVYLSRTQSGIPGLFTGGCLAMHLSEEEFRAVIANPEQARAVAARYGFELTDQHASTLEALKDIAAAQVAQYPQYRGHFDGYRLVRIKRAVRTKLGLAFAAGEYAIAAPARPTVLPMTGSRYVTVWSLRNGIDTSVPFWDVEEVQ